MSDEAPTYRVAWIDTYDGRTDRLISRRRATSEETREIEARWPVIQERPVPEGWPPGPGPYGSDQAITLTYFDDAPPTPRIDFEHDPTARVFRLTAPDGTVEAFRDHPTRYLRVEPDPETGAMRPVIEAGRPVSLLLCREDPEAR